MGFLTGGLFYDMIGKTGNNVGRRVNGRNVVSMAPARGNRTPTQAQLVPQLKLALVSSWMSEISPFLRAGFDGHPTEMSAWNAAVQYNVKYAVTGSLPDFTINYPNVLFSKGKLSRVRDLQVGVSEDAQIDFGWSPVVSGLNPAKPTDQVALIVYNPVKQEWADSIGMAIRADGEYAMAVPLSWSGDLVYPYLSMLGENKLVSTTQFLTSVVIN